MADTARNVLHELRKRYKVSAEHVANAMGVDISTYYRYENGTAKPDIDMAYRAFRAIGAPNGWLMWMVENYPQSFGTVHAFECEEMDRLIYRLLKNEYDTVDELICGLAVIREWIDNGASQL